MRNNLIVRAGFKPAPTLLTAGFALALAFTLSCSSGGDDPGGSPSGGGSLSYEGKTYKTVKIGTQTWMAENLNYNVAGSVCYDNSEANCNKYGRLYDWSTAMALPSECDSSTCSSQINAKHRGICPSSWHIPNDADWTQLTDYVGDESRAGTNKLKAKSGWNEGNGTDNYGFSALPGGLGNSFGSFLSVGNRGYWWSSSEYNSGYAYFWIMGYDFDGTLYDFGGKSILLSVRCVQD